MGKIKVGISIYPLLMELADLQEILEALFVNEIGIRHIEVHSEYLDENIDVFLKLLETSGVKYTMHAPHDATKKTKVRLCSALKKDIELGDYWLTKSIEFAKELGVKLITLHPDRFVYATKGRAKEILRTHLSKALEKLDKGMMLLLENMPDRNYTITTPEDMKDFIKLMGSKKIGCTWDVTHSKLAIGENFLDFPKVLKKNIKHVHLCDIKGRRDHFPLGTGELDLSVVSNSLKKINYSGIVNLEIVTSNPLDLVDSKNRIEQALR
ncbi:MAG: sugar phosphate isomerase/epimerase [Candidatus Aenigmarchaeota archaeon]|nr:sugar phosphate isomerase/epimerase [Candidatus Aenigmarchaeota archaeon]